MRAIVLVLAIAACTPRPKPAATPSAASVDPRLDERGAAAFDAATHGDRLRLVAMVDWPRYRLIESCASACSDEQAASRALAALEVEPQPTQRYIEGATTAMMKLLGDVASGPVPPRVVMRTKLPGPALETQGGGTARSRLAELSRNASAGASMLDYEGQGRVTLLFHDDQLIGVRERQP